MRSVSSGPYRILVVDDNPSIHEDFRRVFQDERPDADLRTAEAELFGDSSDDAPQVSFEVISAHQGEDAVQLITESIEEHRPFGAAFVDMRMPPGWNGIQTIREMWKIDRDLQVVLCTAFSDYSWSELLEQLGTTDRLLLLKKPFDRIEVLLMGMALSQKRRWISAARAQMARLEERVRERTAALQFQAETDRLTGLCNRDVFLRTLQERIDAFPRRKGHQLDGVLFLDLDNFKVVNDTLGHAVGDELLQQVARRLLANTRNDHRVGQHICSRLGGDEFAVLLDRIPSTTVLMDVAQRILTALQRPFAVAGRDVRINASAGIATIDGTCRDAKELVACADTAMYEAKERGKGRVVLFDEQMSERLRLRLEIEQGLRRALQQQAFQFDFQPIVTLDNLKPVYYEALLRWPQPDGEFLSPGQFLPVAQQCGLIEPIGAWVIEEACRRLSELRSRRPPGGQPKLSINVAGHQLIDSGFACFLSEMLGRYQVSGDELILEVTEAELASGVPTIGQNLDICRSLGIEIHMDDFGSGASSLNQLRALPFTGFKLDRSCIHSCDQSGDYALIRGVLELARALELTVVAEGIETESQWARLRQLGCRLGQGYWIGRPIATLAAAIESTTSRRPAVGPA